MITLDPIQLFDADFGPRMVPVTPPDGVISGASSLSPKVLGKAPGRLTQAGWTGVDVNSLTDRCHDYKTAKMWEDWGANVGFAGGDGYVIIDNDQGKEFSDVLKSLFPSAPRRFVDAPKHERDAFFVRVLDFVGEGAEIANRDILFRRGVNTAKLQVLAQGKQAVIYGIHRDTRGPYSWDRKLRDIRDIPELSERKFKDTIRNLIVKLADLGWTTTAPVSPVSRTANRSAGVAPNATKNGATDTPDVDSIIADARAYLDLIPNRELAGNNPSKTKADFWLDDYGNWATLAYALASFMDFGVKETPAAEDLWVEWSSGRYQEQEPVTVWRSAIKQSPRFGPMALVKILRELDALPPGDFPDLDPNDSTFQPSPTPEWDKLSDIYSYFELGGFINRGTARILSRQAFSDRFAHLAKALAKELRSKRLKASVADLFVEQNAKPIVNDLIYAPGDDPMLPGLILNKWRPTKIAPGPVNPSDIRLWLDHAEFVLGSAAECERFVKWCAFVAQYPELKPNWHWLIMSLEGLGKDGLVEPLKAAVGTGVSLGVRSSDRNNWRDAELTYVTESFNRAIETKLLIIGETGQPRSGQLGNDVWTRFKPILAKPPPYLTINEKNIPHYQIPNRQAVILFSNETNPIQTEEGQRRVHVVNSRHITPKPTAYYNGFFGWLESGGSEKVASYLLGYSLSDADKKNFIGGVAPNSSAKLALAALNKPPALTELEDLIEEARSGSGPFSCLLAEAKELAEHIGHRVHKPAPQLVSGWLLDMENKKEGVRRVRINPNKPHQCGFVSQNGVSGRLWALDEKARNGREWHRFTHAELIALWQGKPAPKRTKSAPFPDDEKI